MKMLINLSFSLNLSPKRKTYLKTQTQPQVSIFRSLEMRFLSRKVLPFKKKIIDLFPELQLEVLSLKDEGALLLKGQTYLVYVGKIDLPSHLRGHPVQRVPLGVLISWFEVLWTDVDCTTRYLPVKNLICGSRSRLNPST